MDNQTAKEPVGIIGAGSFGTALATLLSLNVPVLLYSRHQDQVNAINDHHANLGYPLANHVQATSDLRKITDSCELIFPVVPSSQFRIMMKDLGPLLHPYHILIHGTKGLDYSGLDETALTASNITRSDVHTMSEVICQESPVVRVGCLSGPNLASEILDGQPAATLIASAFDEVINEGQNVLSSDRFQVFGSHDIIGAEWAGALKNVIAIGSGILGGLNMGKNIQSMLIIRGLYEMIRIGQALGSNQRSFFGTAGIGDLIATATSDKSRNYSFGQRVAGGMPPEEAIEKMPELAEGVRTIKIVWHLSRYYKVRIPIMAMIYRIIFEGYAIQDALNFLMKYPYDVDVDI